HCAVFLPALCLHTATSQPSTLSLHDALPISRAGFPRRPLCGRLPSGSPATRAHARGLIGFVRLGCRLQIGGRRTTRRSSDRHGRSEEHTSELQSPCNLVCRLLLEKKKTVLTI